MTSSSPEEIRRDIERTRQELSNDVDALHEKVSPARIAERRVQSAKSAVSSVKEKIMGGASDTTSAAGGGLSTATDKVSGAGSAVAGAASSAGSAVAGAASSAPQVARQKTEGNPLAAGLIAFGVGWLVSSLVPASEKEQRAAMAVKDKASEHSDKITGPLSEAAHEVTDNLREPAQQAAESIKSTAADAKSTVQSEAQSAKEDVTGQAQQAKDTVTSSASSDGGSESSIDLGTAEDATTYGGQSFGSR